MSAVGHIPGPFTWRPRDHGGFAIYAGSLPIATVPAIGFVPTNEDGRKKVAATAVLFAAAPDMLAALKYAHDQLSSWIAGSGEGSDCLADIQAAIAKATGAGQ